MVKTVTLTADTPQKVTFDGAYPYYWIDNKSASDVYASVGVPEADADGTYTVEDKLSSQVQQKDKSSEITSKGVL